ncbi:CHAP domain-containing protein [Nocardioides astragali]|uniref:CHAP domain-containing protein n=1 Tax=Nocardioides astragali TaxID=1776736 RepID=A0ABW2N7G7_9ACTN|nr:CHAP domain-containing protein [Nocardioides astragali]
MGNKQGRRAVAAGLASACVAAALLVASGPAAHASDDYPWAWQGQCPIIPQAPIEPPPPPPLPTPTPTPTPTPDKPGETPDPVVPTPPPPPPPPPPVLDPVTGHMYDPRGPKPTCERRVWSINGSIGDAWGFVLRNCTSFVAWRMQERNRLAGFSNHFRGHHWGDARNWDDVARTLGYRVDTIPAIGAVAQSDAGRVGHVAWVTDVGPGTVTIEEYNHATPGGYGIRTVPVGEFRYLHLDDVAPSPLIGSSRPVVSVSDGLGESWTARVDAAGTLRVARPGRPARLVGVPGAFSPLAAPAIVLDPRGEAWVAATTTDGRVLAGTTRRAGFALHAVGTAAPTSSPALALTRTRRPLLATISPAGDLSTRRLTRERRWSRPLRVGRPGSWATHTAPVLGHDGAGRTWLVAVTSGGATYAQSVERGRLVRLPGPAGSITSTPALTRAGDGTTYLHQVAATGQLTVRGLAGPDWRRIGTVAGSWSPYASPAVAEIAGELHVAGALSNGAVLVRSAVPGRRSRLPVRVLSSGDPTRSPGLVTRSNAGIFVVADSRQAARARLLTRPASALVGDSAPTRAGFTP